MQFLQGANLNVRWIMQNVYFFRFINALFSKIGRLASEEVFLHLLKSKCMPVLLYSLEVCPLNILRFFDFTVTRGLMKLFLTCNLYSI